MTETGQQLETVRISNDPEYLRQVARSAGRGASRRATRQAVRPWAAYHSPATVGLASQWVGPIRPRWTSRRSQQPSCGTAIVSSPRADNRAAGEARCTDATSG